MTADFRNFVAKTDEKRKSKDEMNRTKGAKKKYRSKKEIESKKEIKVQKRNKSPNKDWKK